MQSSPVTECGPTCRIVIVEDHELMRLGVAHVVRNRSGWELCGEAGDCVRALQLIQETRPDLAIVDLRLPGGDSLELIKQIRRDVPSCSVLVLSAQEENLFAERVLRAGAQGFVSKQDPLLTLVEAIQKVLEGRIAVSARMTERLLAIRTGRPGHDRSPLETLSDREMEVFECLGRGMTVKENAHQLQLSVKTVEYHRQNIVEKLGLSGSKELTGHATMHALGQAPPVLA